MGSVGSKFGVAYVWRERGSWNWRTVKGSAEKMRRVVSEKLNKNRAT